MSIDPGVFRAYDIRGRVGTSITPELAVTLGRAFGTHMRQLDGASAPSVAVGSDNRQTSPELKGHLIDGLVSSGCSVLDIGLSTSPLLYFTVARWDLAGGINVTGSHNPPDENGFKLVGRGARPIADDELKGLYRLMLSGRFTNERGRQSTLDPTDTYFEHLIRSSSVTRAFRLVTDTGNGVAGLFAPPLLRAIGCDVDELYCELDPTFPNHLPDPQMPENVSDMQARVRETGADLGVAFDGDGDRLGVCDDLGLRREADYILMLLARELLERRPGSTVLLDVKSSQGVVDDIQAHGGVPVLTRTGHSLIKLRMRAEAVPLGGENSGHMFFEDDYYIDDGLFATCRLLTFLSSHERPLSAYFPDPPPWYSTPEIRVPCPDDVKATVVERTAAVLRHRYPAIETDGIRADMGDGWALVRASNTGPNLTVRFEARSEERLDGIRREVMEIVRSEIDRATAG